MRVLNKIEIQSTFVHIAHRALQLFFFALPWSSAIIIHEAFLGIDKLQYGTRVIWVSEFFLCIALLAVCIDMLYTQKTRDICIVALTIISTVGYAIVQSYALNSDIWLALEKIRFLFEGLSLIYIFSYLQYTQKYLITLFAYAMLLPAVYGIISFFTQSVFSLASFGIADHLANTPGTSVVVHAQFGRFVRAYGGFVHPNIFGGYLAYALVMLWYVRLSAVNAVYTIRDVFVQIILWVALICSFSRSAWIAVILGGVFLFFVYYKKVAKRLNIHIFALLFVTSILSYQLFPLIQGRLFGGEVHEIVSIQERIAMYPSAISLFKTQPWWGVGIGGYTQALMTLSPHVAGWQYQPVHNGILLWIVEWGVGGMILALVALYYLLFIRNLRIKGKILLCLVCITVIPLLFFDHYVISMYSGNMLLAVVGGIVLSKT